MGKIVLLDDSTINKIAAGEACICCKRGNGKLD